MKRSSAKARKSCVLSDYDYVHVHVHVYV